MDAYKLENIKVGLHVAIELKKDQRTKKLTEGYIRNVLTKSSKHHYGIKVRLETGEIGRVKEILDEI